MRKRVISVILAMIIVLTLAVPAMAADSIIAKTEYQGRGYVEVDFTEDVSYQKPKITVKDSAGKSYTVKITKRDSDELTFRVQNFKSGIRYTYSISGIKSRSTGKLVKEKGSFRTPVSELAIREVDYSVRDRELEIEFYGNVQYKNVKVTVKDASGRTYQTKITEKDSREIEVHVKGLVKGKKYTVTVSGVRLKGSGSYKSISKKFKA